jgi:hypothetical protein
MDVTDTQRRRSAYAELVPIPVPVPLGLGPGLSDVHTGTVRRRALMNGISQDEASGRPPELVNRKLGHLLLPDHYW